MAAEEPVPGLSVSAANKAAAKKAAAKKAAASERMAVAVVLPGSVHAAATVAATEAAVAAELPADKTAVAVAEQPLDSEFILMNYVSTGAVAIRYRKGKQVLQVTGTTDNRGIADKLLAELQRGKPVEDVKFLMRTLKAAAAAAPATPQASAARTAAKKS